MRNPVLVWYMSISAGAKGPIWRNGRISYQNSTQALYFRKKDIIVDTVFYQMYNI